MSDLTPRQTQILRLIQRFIGENGMPHEARVGRIQRNGADQFERKARIA